MLYYTICGSKGGRPILFLHPASFDGRIWAPVAGNLPGFSSVLIDLPGHGRSTSIEFRNFEAAADDVAHTIRALKCGPVVIVGLSMGAYVGLQLLKRHRELIECAIFSGVQAMPIKIGGFARLMMFASAWVMNWRFVRRRMAKAMGVEDGSLSSSESGKPNASAATTRRVANHALKFDIIDELGKLTTRTLFLAGAKEHSAILSSLDIFEREMPASVSRIVPGQGHGWIAREPLLLTETIIAWSNKSTLPEGLVSPSKPDQADH